MTYPHNMTGFMLCCCLPRLTQPETHKDDKIFGKNACSMHAQQSASAQLSLTADFDLSCNLNITP